MPLIRAYAGGHISLSPRFAFLRGGAGEQMLRIAGIFAFSVQPTLKIACKAKKEMIYFKKYKTEGGKYAEQQ